MYKIARAKFSVCFERLHDYLNSEEILFLIDESNIFIVQRRISQKAAQLQFVVI